MISHSYTFVRDNVFYDATFTSTTSKKCRVTIISSNDFIDNSVWNTLNEAYDWAESLVDEVAHTRKLTEPQLVIPEKLRGFEMCVSFAHKDQKFALLALAKNKIEDTGLRFKSKIEAIELLRRL